MKIYNKLTLIVLILAFSACQDDFLDLQDPNAITSGSFWSSPADVEAAVVTLYPEFNAVWDGAAEPANLRSDAVALAAPDFAQFNRFYTFVNTPINGISDRFWFNAYTVIFRANTILKEIENVQFTDAAQKATLIAEAQFFRGASFFRIAHAYGDAPIPLEPAETEEQFNMGKSDAAAVWDQAIADLQAAKAGLPVDQDLPGRVTKGAVMGFLGKLYLYRAGYLNDNSYYAQAASELKAVIDLGKYSLVENWLDNYTAANENNEESLYEAQYDVFSGSYSVTQPRPGNASVPGISGEIVSKPSEWIFNEMSKEMTMDGTMDTRLLNTLYFEGSEPLFGVAFADLGDGLVCAGGGGGGAPVEGPDCWEEDLTGEDGFWVGAIEELVPGAAIEQVLLQGCWDPVAETEFENIAVTVDQGCRIIFNNWEQNVIGNGCEASNDGGSFPGWFRKYLPVSYACYLDGPAVNNERILRYADILLMYAEAVVQSGGSLADATEAVNQIRTRVNLEMKDFADGNALMEEIEHQRVMEFVMEGTRYFDLIRWGRLQETLNAHGFPDGASRIGEKHKYFPIPVGEVNSNEMLDQNPLWN